MNLQFNFPLIFWINLGRRQDRRFETESALQEIGIQAIRFPAVDAKRLKEAKNRASTNSENTTASPNEALYRGYSTRGRYALALTQRLIIREAKRRKSPAVLIFEDDVVFHPNLKELIKVVELPGDWGIFYLGCAHCLPPDWVGNRLVRANYAVDTHALAIKAEYYDVVLKALNRHGKICPPETAASDRFLADLHVSIPTYACYPNLAWQAANTSDLAGKAYSNYTRDGLQKHWPEVVGNLLPDLVKDDGGLAMPLSISQLMTERKTIDDIKDRTPVKIALLFLTRGDVNHPQIWREFIDGNPSRVSIYSHPKFPARARRGFLANTLIKDLYRTEWGSISLVKASRALLLAALEDPTNTHFILLSESCVPVISLNHLIKRIELDPRSQFGFRRVNEAAIRHASRIYQAPSVPFGCWRFTSQWWMLDRVAAVFAAGIDFTNSFSNMFVADEAYFATVMCMQGFPLDGGVIPKDVTWTWWEEDAGSPTSWPVMASTQLKLLIHSGAHFARKFPRNADIGRYKLHCD